MPDIKEACSVFDNNNYEEETYKVQDSLAAISLLDTISS
jgi:hypothetical protein